MLKFQKSNGLNHFYWKNFNYISNHFQLITVHDLSNTETGTVTQLITEGHLFEVPQFEFNWESTFLAICYLYLCPGPEFTN